MKTFYIVSLLSFLSFSVIAQMPKLINYQAVARNNSGQPIANQTIQVRLTIVNTAAGNATLYTETRSIATNASGLFSVQIGAPGAVASSGNLSDVSWTNNTSSKESLKVELDINNNGTFIDMGVQSLTSVPYAFAADMAIDAVNIGGHYIDTQTPQTGDILMWTGTAWAPRRPASVYPIVGTPNVVSGGSLAFQWAATPTQITVYAGQVITAVVSASLGTTSGTATAVGIDLAYQGQGPITAFRPADYISIAGISQRELYTVSGTIKVMPAGADISNGEIRAGTYNIGLALRNTSATSINNSQAITGFILVQ